MKALLIAAFALVAASPAMANAQKERCEIAAQIVSQAVELRQAGTGKRRAEKQMMEALTDAQQGFRPVVYQTLDWVWGLKKSDVTPAMADALQEQCLEYN